MSDRQKAHTQATENDYAVSLRAERDRVIDRHGDVWTLGEDGLMHTPETRPFPREFVEKKWGPLRPAGVVTPPGPTTAGDD